VSDYETVIGLEAHVQLQTRTKLFCGCAVRFGEPPNSLTCPVCLGMPGSMPVLNKRAFEYAILTALALECDVQAETKFDRKHYYYPDLPKNYQVSQYDRPYALRGGVEIDVNGDTRRIGLTRIHIEEDAGKSIHDAVPGVTCVDLNRTGTPLLEIVSEPELRTPAEAGAYLRTLKQTLEYLEVSDCNMQEGSLRCDANVSLRPRGQEAFGTKVEIKNLNSIKGVEDALAHEMVRQAAELDAGQAIAQETRLWDADRGVTRGMRTKEGESDYRYFPEPDLPLYRVEQAWIAEIGERLPELPQARRERFEQKLGLNAYDAGVLSAEKPLADYYEDVVAAGSDPAAAKNWVSQAVMSRMNEKKISLADFGEKVSAKGLADMIGLIAGGTIDQSTAREVVFPAICETGRDAAAIVEEQGLAMVSDGDAILDVTRRVIEDDPKPLNDSVKNAKAANKYIGMVRKAMDGKADVKVVREAIMQVISEKRGEPFTF
jgi:aspartyl-tRNA(Asn)/glutamyl-tRNA(Gln) amidotransferase subunit B